MQTTTKTVISTQGYKLQFFAREKLIIWNNRDVCINKAPVSVYETFFESGIICVNDQLFDLNNLNSLNIISKQVGKVSFLTLAGLRHAIPSHLKMGNYNDKVFNVLKKQVKGLILVVTEQRSTVS